MQLSKRRLGFLVRRAYELNLIEACKADSREDPRGDEVRAEEKHFL